MTSRKKNNTQMNKKKEESMRAAMRGIMESMMVGDVHAWDTSNRNFNYLVTCFNMLKKVDREMMKRKFTGYFSHDKELYYIKRTA